MALVQVEGESTLRRVPAPRVQLDHLTSSNQDDIEDDAGVQLDHLHL